VGSWAECVSLMREKPVEWSATLHDHAESITQQGCRPAFRRIRAGEGSSADCFLILHNTLVDGCAGFLFEDQMDG